MVDSRKALLLNCRLTCQFQSLEIKAGKRKIRLYKQTEWQTEALYIGFSQNYSENIAIKINYECLGNVEIDLKSRYKCKDFQPWCCG